MRRIGENMMHLWAHEDGGIVGGALHEGLGIEAIAAELADHAEGSGCHHGTINWVDVGVEACQQLVVGAGHSSEIIVIVPMALAGLAGRPGGVRVAVTDAAGIVAPIKRAGRHHRVAHMLRLPSIGSVACVPTFADLGCGHVRGKRGAVRAEGRGGRGGRR